MAQRHSGKLVNQTKQCYQAICYLLEFPSKAQKTGPLSSYSGNGGEWHIMIDGGVQTKPTGTQPNQQPWLAS